MKKHGILFALVLSIVSLPGISNAALVAVRSDTLARWITNGTTFDFIFIDIRDTVELSSIIATSVCRPYHLSWNQGAFRTRMGMLPKNAHIVLYCRTDNRSGQAGQLLVDSGYASVYHLDGGIAAWTGPTMTAASVKPFAELPAPSMRMASTAILAPRPGQGATLSLRENRGTLIVPFPLTVNHRLALFDLRGRLVFEVGKPFSRSAGFSVPPDPATATRIAVLFVDNRFEAMIRVNPRVN